MKELFQEYHPVDNDLVVKLWGNAIFVFDSNVLLNLYRYSDITSNKFIDTITEFKDRIWIPFQVGLEFNRNRLIVISKEKKNYSDFETKINGLIEDIEDRNRNPFFSKKLTNKITEIRKGLGSEIEKKMKRYEGLFKDDDILDKINNTFESNIGKNYSYEDELSLRKEGEKRYNDDIPPGYCDKKKPENRRYGDLLIWKQIIDKSKASKVDVILVLDDRKQDWWYEHEGKTISARPELLKEFRTETHQNIHFYKPFQFLEYSNKYLEKKINEDVIQEVKYHIPLNLETENLIGVNLKLQGSFDNFKTLIEDLEDSGYNIFYRTEKTHSVHYLRVLLPNIPDLVRRLDSKFLSRLSNYNLVLIERAVDGKLT